MNEMPSILRMHLYAEFATPLDGVKTAVAFLVEAIEKRLITVTDWSAWDAAIAAFAAKDPAGRELLHQATRRAEGAAYWIAREGKGTRHIVLQTDANAHGFWMRKPPYLAGLRDSLPALDFLARDDGQGGTVEHPYQRHGWVQSLVAKNGVQSLDVTLREARAAIAPSGQEGDPGSPAVAEDRRSLNCVEVLPGIHLVLDDVIGELGMRWA